MRQEVYSLLRQRLGYISSKGVVYNNFVNKDGLMVPVQYANEQIRVDSRVWPTPEVPYSSPMDPSKKEVVIMAARMVEQPREVVLIARGLVYKFGPQFPKEFRPAHPLPHVIAKRNFVLPRSGETWGFDLWKALVVNGSGQKEEMEFPDLLQSCEVNDRDWEKLLTTHVLDTH